MSETISPKRLSQLSDFLNRRLGLDFPTERAKELECAVRRASEELGFSSLEEGLEKLVAGKPSQAQIEVLASHLTISETYFFREPIVFSALENSVLREMIRAKRAAGDRRLSLWSAGCATGEEAYSLAIAISRLLPDLAEWRVSILGTDINPRALQKATEGVYGEWSFRGTAPLIKAAYFEDVGQRRHRVKPNLRQLVSFAYLNLADAIYPSLLTQTAGLDVILCRNVLLYFSRESAQQVTARFYQCLQEGGWLVGGVAEHFRAPGFKTVLFDGRPLFQKVSRTAMDSRPLGWTPPRWEDEAVAAAEAQIGAERSAFPASKTSRGSAGSSLELARRCANQGRLREALEHCEAAIRLERLAAGHHYLRAMILTELGELIPAEHALRQTLYLDPQFILAHFSLAAAARRRGQKREAERHMKNTAALLAESNPDSLLPGSDGVTVRQFTAFVSTCALG